MNTRNREYDEYRAKEVVAQAQMIQPTEDEWRRIEEALPRWAEKGRPTVADILMDPRPGILSIVSGIYASGLTLEEVRERAA